MDPLCGFEFKQLIALMKDEVLKLLIADECCFVRLYIKYDCIDLRYVVLLFSVRSMH